MYPKLFGTILIALAVILVSLSASAQTNPFLSIRAQMSAAREASTLIMTKSGTNTAQQRKIVKESVEAVTDSLNKASAPAGKAAQLNELRTVWAAYQKTTLTEILPAIQSSREIDAQRLLQGIQRERFNRCQQLVVDLL